MTSPNQQHHRSYQCIFGLLAALQICIAGCNNTTSPSGPDEPPSAMSSAMRPSKSIVGAWQSTRSNEEINFFEDGRFQLSFSDTSSGISVFQKGEGYWMESGEDVDCEFLRSTKIVGGSGGDLPPVLFTKTYEFLSETSIRSADGDSYTRI